MTNKYVVYKFVDLRDESVAYVGSTSNIVRRRLDHLNQDGKRHPKIFSKIYHSNPENFSLEICCSFAYINSLELRKGERVYFDILKPKYNLKRPYATYEENRLRKNEHKRLKYQNDPIYCEAVKLKRKLRYQTNPTYHEAKILKDRLYRQKKKEQKLCH